MRTLYIDCGMGVAGDMLTAALLELLPEPDAFLGELNALGIPGVEYRREPSVKCGITGTRVSVRAAGGEERHHHGHPCSRLEDVERIVKGLPLGENVRADILAVYDRIAAAESTVHGVPAREVHFHEVGTADAIADVTAVCCLMDRLAPEEVVVSPICVGTGSVRCAHGLLPVPAPAVEELLRGVPYFGGEKQGELCTPTGAALLRHFAARFGDMPVLRVSAIGYGMGTRDFGWANCVRVLLGES